MVTIFSKPEPAMSPQNAAPVTKTKVSGRDGLRGRRHKLRPRSSGKSYPRRTFKSKLIQKTGKHRRRRNSNNSATVPHRRHRIRMKVAEKKRKFISRADAVLYRLAPHSPSSSRFSPRPAETVAASFHQRSSQKGLLSEFRGFQCTSMSLAAILISKSLPVESWKTIDLDGILRYGDILHQDLLYRRVKRFDDPRLALNEIPTGDHNKYKVPRPDRTRAWYGREYSDRQRVVLSKSEEIYGLVHTADNSVTRQHCDLGYTPIEEALATIFALDYDGIILTVGEISGAVFADKNSEKIRYFDSHCNNKWGRLCLDGTAVLLTFDNIPDFIRLIRKREPRIHYRYELIGLKIQCLPESNDL